jgi:hypothetical protein
LKTTLDADLPALNERLAAGDVQGVNDLLHQFKGFAPVLYRLGSSDVPARYLEPQFQMPRQ